MERSSLIFLLISIFLLIFLIVSVGYFIIKESKDCPVEKQAIKCYDLTLFCTKGCIQIYFPENCDEEHSYEKEVCLE